MTQFKVGDKVLDKSDGDVGIVIDRHDYGKVWAKWGSTGEELWFDPNDEDYELVEQPKSSTTNKPHKYKDLIIAWANGAEIEYYSSLTNKWYNVSNPEWDEDEQYRIKPEPKPDVVKYLGLEYDFDEEQIAHGEFRDRLCFVDHWDNQIKVTFDAQTGKLKAAEVIS